MRRAYSYNRFSRKHQELGDSLRRQTSGAQAYCDRKQWILDESLRLQDLGVSAFTGKNAEVGALAVFLEAVRTGRVPRGSVLIVESLDRLSRQDIDAALDLFKQLLRAGIDIVTLQPEREYTRESLKDIVQLLEPLFIMSRAHEESETKSQRLRAMWAAKRANMPNKPATPWCPAWLRLKADHSGYEVVPSAVAAVLRIHQLAREGFGCRQIITQLDKEGIPPFGGRKPYWCQQYIGRILRTRAVLGEFQPHVLREGKYRPEGKPIPNYFPVLMTEEEWYATQAGLTSRRTQRGRRGKHVRNLFTELVWDARNGCSMMIKNGSRKGTMLYLVSSDARLRQRGSESQSVPYPAFEEWFLSWVHGLSAADLRPQESNGREEKLAALNGRLIDLDYRIQTFQKAADAHPDAQSVADTLVDLEQKKRATSAELEQLKRQQTSNEAETLGEAQSLIDLLAECPEEELLELRTRLKARIRALVKEMWVLVERQGSEKIVTTQVFFRDKAWQQIVAFHHKDGTHVIATRKLSSPLDKVDDLREWRKLPPEERPVWEVEPLEE